MKKTKSNKIIETLFLIFAPMIVAFLFLYIPVTAVIAVWAVENDNHTAYIIANWLLAIPLGGLMLVMFFLALAMVVLVLVTFIKSLVGIWKS